MFVELVILHKIELETLENLDCHGFDDMNTPNTIRAFIYDPAQSFMSIHYLFLVMIILWTDLCLVIFYMR